LYSIFQIFSKLKLKTSFSASFILNKIFVLFFHFLKSVSILNSQVIFEFSCLSIFFQEVYQFIYTFSLALKSFQKAQNSIFPLHSEQADILKALLGTQFSQSHTS
jgi:hypothetical protein